MEPEIEIKTARLSLGIDESTARITLTGICTSRCYVDLGNGKLREAVLQRARESSHGVGRLDIINTNRVRSTTVSINS